MLRTAQVVMVGVAMALMTQPSLAGTPNSQNEVDIGPVFDKLEVSTDGRGHYVVAVPMSDLTVMYYGNDKEQHQQRVSSGGSHDGKKTSSRQFWEPVAAQEGQLLYDNGKWSIHCQARETPLVKASPEVAERILTKAVFKLPKWKREALYLARDNVGTYYYVDKLRDERPDNLVRNSPNRVKGHRLFVGRRGRMRLQRVTDATDDSSGVVLNFPGGALAVNHVAKTAILTRGRRETSLLLLETRLNKALIYRDLGMYGALGTPCDDL